MPQALYENDPFIKALEAERAGVAIAAPPSASPSERPPNWGPSEERRFRNWYAGIFKQHGLDPSPDNNAYDFRTAFRAGVREPGLSGWPTAFVRDPIPNVVPGAPSPTAGDHLRGFGGALAETGLGFAEFLGNVLRTGLGDPRGAINIARGIKEQVAHDWRGLQLDLPSGPADVLTLRQRLQADPARVGREVVTYPVKVAGLVLDPAVLPVTPAAEAFERGEYGKSAGYTAGGVALLKAPPAVVRRGVRYLKEHGTGARSAGRVEPAHTTETSSRRSLADAPDPYEAALDEFRAEHLGPEYQSVIETPTYTGPERRATVRTPDAAADAMYQRMRERVAAGEQTGTPEARVDFAERQRVEAARRGEQTASEIPVTRIVDKDAAVYSDKPDTWVVVGHLDDARAAQLNDMYKAGAGRVERGYVDRDAVDLSLRQSDEFGNTIAAVRTGRFRSTYRPVESQAVRTRSSAAPASGPTQPPRPPADLIDVSRTSPERVTMGEIESALATGKRPGASGDLGSPAEGGELVGGYLDDAPRPRVADTPQAIFNEVLNDARRSGYEGSDLALRRTFDERVTAAREFQNDMTALAQENSPRRLFEAISARGGISIKDAKRHGLIDPDAPVDRFGTLGGVPGVLRHPRAFSAGQQLKMKRSRDGLTLSEMSQLLKADPEGRWAALEDETSLLSALDDALRAREQSAPSLREALHWYGVRPGEKWWEAASAEDVGFDTASFDAETGGGGGAEPPVRPPAIGGGGELPPSGGGGGEGGGPPARPSELAISRIYTPSEAATAKILQPIDEGAARTPAGSIPAERLFHVPAWVPDEFKSDYAALLKKYRGFETERRGTMSAERRRELASQVQVPVNVPIRPGVPLDAVRFEAVKGLWEGVTDRIRELKEKVNAKTATDADLIQLEEAKAEQLALTKTVQQSVSEAGRALQAAKGLRAILDTQDSDLIASVADKVRGGKLSAYVAGNVFSGVSTFDSNFLSNTSMWMFDVAAEAVGNGRPLSSVSMAVGGIAGVPRGIKDFIYTMRHGSTPPGLLPIVEKIDTGDFKTLGAANPWNIVLRSLRATDALARAISKQSEMYRYAYLEAVKQGGRRNRTMIPRMAQLRAEHALDWGLEAEKTSRNRVFMDPLGKVASAVANLRSAVPGMRFVVLVLRTASNLTKMAVEATPAPFLAAQGIKARRMAAASRYASIRAMAERLEKHEPELGRLFLENSRRGELVRSRAAFGSLVVAGLTPMITAGLITGKGPSDRAEKAVWLRDHQAYSIWTGDRWWSYRKIPAAAPLIASIADGWQAAQDALKTTGRVDWSEVAFQVIGRSLRFITIDQSFLFSLGQLFDSFSAPNMGEALEKAASRIALMFDPMVSLQRSVVSVTDPTMRDPRGIEEEFAAATPGLSKTVPPVRDPFGRPVERAAGAPLGFTRTKTPDTDRVDALLKRLNLSKLKPSGRLSEGPEDQVYTTRDEEDVLTEARGQEQYARTLALLETKGFRDLVEKHPSAARKVVRSAWSEATEYVNAQARILKRKRQPLTLNALLSKTAAKGVR